MAPTNLFVTAANNLSFEECCRINLRDAVGVRYGKGQLDNPLDPSRIGGLEEHRELPHRCPGRSSNHQQLWCILGLRIERRWRHLKYHIVRQPSW